MKNVPNRIWTLTPVNGTLSSAGLVTATPSQVIGLVAVLISSTFVDISWTAASNSVGYVVYLGGVQVSSTSLTSARVSNLSPSTAYAITVRGVNSIGTLGPVSATLNVTTLASPVWLGTIFPLFQQGTARSYDLAAFIAPETAGVYANIGTSLPSGVTLNTANGLLSYDGVGAVSDVSTYQFSFDPDGAPAVFNTANNLRIQIKSDSIPTVPTVPASASITSTGFTLSWTASTDSGSNLQGYRVWRNGLLYQDTGNTSVSLGITGQSAGVTAIWRVSAYDTVGNESGRSVALSVTQGSTLPVWTVNTPAYLPIVPGAACFGADQWGGSGRHLGGSNNAAIMYIDDRGTGTTGSFDSGTRIGYGTSKYCANAAFPRHVIPLVNGLIDYTTGGSRNILIDQPYMTFHGHAAPGHLIYRGTLWLTNASDLTLWHVMIMQDIYTSPSQADSSGDCTQLLSSPLPQNVLWANSGFMYATDETIDWFRPIQNAGIWQSILTEPIQNGNHPEFPHNYGMIIANTATPVSAARNIFAHCQARHPLTSSPRLTFHNNLVYNFGQTGTEIINTSPVVTDSNIEGNFYITGPNTNTNDCIRIFSSVLPGTRVYLAGNKALGVADASQTDMLENSEGLTLESARLSGAYPAGAVVTAISDESQFADLVLRHAGPRPSSRNVALQRTIDNINARISGVGNQGGFVSTPTSAGGYPSITNVGPIDPASPGSYWGGVPVPQTLSTRNVVQASGYTLIEEWSHGVASLFMPVGWDD